VSFWGLFRGGLVRFRSPLLAVVLAGLAAFLLYRLSTYQSLEQWLVFRYLGYWAICILALLASTTFGYALVLRVVGHAWSVPERLAIGAAVGVAAFGIGWNALGFLHLYGAWTMAAWPLALFALGAPTLWRERRRLWRYRLRTKRLQGGLTLVEVALLCVGAVGLLLAYGANLTPQNVAFDARWYHLPMAERYAVDGGIVRYADGWFLAGYPHLASILYSWCFSLPFATTFDRVELCLHFEFVLFLATLASVGVLARTIAPRGSPLPRFGAFVLFLFPEFFIYDSSLNGGADHVAAFWAPALFLVTRRVWTRFGRGPLIFLAILVSAVMLTKYTAYGLLVGPALGLFGRAVWLAVRDIKAKRPVVPLLARCGLVVLALLVLTTPHFLKNFVFYDNPFFPLASDWFHGRPWSRDAATRLFTMYGTNWTPVHDWEGVATTLAQPVTFPFTPRDWPTFHHEWPMFGFLFTLLTPVLAFGRTRSLLGLYAVANLGVMFWFWTYHQDRYLQAYLPWMTAGTWVAAVIAGRLGKWSLAATIALFFVQWSWGADAPFFGSHAVAGQPLRTTIDHLSGGFAGRPLEQRLAAYGDMEQLRQKLPKDARVLRHEMQIHLGLGVSCVTDWFQSGIDYTERPSPAGVQEILRKTGVTHLIWHPSSARGFNSVGMDVLFFDYVEHYVDKPSRVGGVMLTPLGKRDDLPKSELVVLYAGCDGTYAPGIYGAGEMSRYPYAPPAPQIKPRTRLGIKGLSRKLDEVDAVVWGARCQKGLDDPARHGFTSAAKRGDDTIFVRRAGRPARPLP